MRVVVIGAASVLAVVGVVFALIHFSDGPSNQYTIEDSQQSPDGKYIATRFQEATPFVVCSEVVVVMPSSMKFSTRSVEDYVPYAAFSEDCSVGVQTRWTGIAELEIASTINKSEEFASKKWLSSPLSSQVSLTFRRLEERP